MEWYQWLTVIGIPGTITGIALIMINRTIARSDRRRAEEEEQRIVREQEIKNQNKAMEAQNEALMLGVQAMLRDRLLQGYRHYADKGWADYDDRENMENMYKQYHALGANGVMDGYRDRFLALPDHRK